MQISNAPTTTAPIKDARLDRAATEFEGMFIAQLLNVMRDATKSFSPTPSSLAQAGEGLMDHAWRLVADDLAKTHAFGIADQLVAQLQVTTPPPAED